MKTEQSPEQIKLIAIKNADILTLQRLLSNKSEIERQIQVVRGRIEGIEEGMSIIEHSNAPTQITGKE